MQASDKTLHEYLDSGALVIDPFFDSIQPASIDLHLDNRFLSFDTNETTHIDPYRQQDHLTKSHQAEEFILHPGQFILASTLERVALSSKLVARIEGKSSLGRLGLLVHATAGFVDPGWDGWLTLELSNVANLPIILRSGMLIAQLAVSELSTEAEMSYGGKYQYASPGPTASRYYLNYQKD